MVALLAKDPAQTLNVGVVELPEARSGPLRSDQPLAFEKADLGNGDIGEVLLDEREDLTD